MDGKNNNIPAKFTWTSGERQFCPFKVRTLVLLDSGSYSFSLPKINYFCAHFYKIVKQRIVNWQRYTAKCQRTVFSGPLCIEDLGFWGYLHGLWSTSFTLFRLIENLLRKRRTRPVSVKATPLMGCTELYSDVR